MQTGRCVAFVVNGDAGSAMADRARAFAARIGSPWQVHTTYRAAGRFGDVAAFNGWLSEIGPDTVYVLDMALAGVVASSWYRWRRQTRLIIDTGDAITELARSLRGPAGVAATSMLERLAMASADRIVVRGSFHAELLSTQGIASTVIQDGVDLNLFSPRDSRAIRARLGLGDALVVGLVGSCIWSQSLRMAYGWELVEVLASLRDENVRGVLIGDGTGIAHLQRRARELDVEHRIVFAGRRPMTELPDLLSACDICLSTQTNDVAGNVRTTGKLPLYLACGRYVLSSEVGEARRVLPKKMLVPYEGTVDRAYPARLASCIRALTRDTAALNVEAESRALARANFDYDMLSARLMAVLSGAPDPVETGALALKSPN